MSSNPKYDYPLARSVRVIGDYLYLKLKDGREFIFELAIFPNVYRAPIRAREKVRIIYSGTGIEWTALGFELGVGGLIRQALANMRK